MESSSNVKKIISVLLSALLLIDVNLFSQVRPTIHLEKYSTNQWLVWIPSQPRTNGIWAIEASPTYQTNDWFVPPSFFDDGRRLQVIVPNTPMMIFRARLVKR